MKRFTSLFALFLLFGSQLVAQSGLLQSGPMLGYNEMREALLWVQTNAPATVQFVYWPEAEPENRRLSAEKTTVKEEAFTAKLLADQVEPGTKYGYELLINGEAVKLPYPTGFETQMLWQWRTGPPAFKVAIGSCAYVNETVYDRPGKPYGSDYQIFRSIHQQRPDAMVWLGDNTYLREADWFSRTGILHRYTHTRSLPEMQPLLASTHHYAIWDDHDFGPNNSDRSFIHKDKSLEAFRLFWGNPNFGLPGQGGITSFFQYNDIEFFLLDNRYFRSPNKRQSGEATMLGKEQLEWLIDALSGSYAPFKMVCIGGQVLNTAPGEENYADHFKEEQAYLLQRIEEENIKNVIFLTGDRHHTTMSQYVNAKGNAVYDLTVSSLTAGVYAAQENNTLLMEGTYVAKHNFGLLEFSGPRLERKLTIRILDADGQEQWVREIMPEK